MKLLFLIAVLSGVTMATGFDEPMFSQWICEAQTANGQTYFAQGPDEQSASENLYKTCAHSHAICEFVRCEVRR